MTWKPALLLALLAAALAGRSFELSARHLYPVYDELSYLDLARDSAGRGGIFETVSAYAAGELLEDNRHPLYFLLLAPLMDGTPQDFTRAKLVSLACVWLLILALFLIARPIWGESVALACAAAAAFSPLSAVYAQTLAPDWLFAGLYFAAVMTLAGWHERPWSWPLCGFLSGLAYLAKGNGHALLASILAVGLWRWRWGFLRSPRLYLALAGFGAGAWFLLLRNILVWGDPFHHLLTKVMWIDEGDHYLRLLASPQWAELGPSWYWRNHAFGEAVWAMADGLASAAVALVSSLSVGPSARPVALASGGVLLVLAVAGLRDAWRRGRREEVLAVLAPALPMLLAFAWTAKHGPVYPRFVFPISVTLLPMAAMGARELFSVRLGRRSVEPGLAAVTAAAVFLGLAGGLWTRDPRGFWGVPPFWSETSRWIARQVDGAGYLMDNWSLYSNWDAPPSLRREYPFDVPAAELERVLSERGIRYLLVDMNLWGMDSHKDKYGPADAAGPVSFLGRRRCFAAPAERSVFLIYADRCPS